MTSTVILIAVSAYLIAMVLVGIWAGRKVKNNDDFMLAGQRLGRAILTGTLLATWTGAGTMIGRANFSYTYGPLASVFYSMGAPLGILIMYFLLAKRIRQYSKYTVPQIMQAKYGTSVRVLTAVAILLAYSSILSEQVRGLGYILHLTTGFPEEVAKIGGLALIVFLAFIGGLISVAYTDAISALLISIGLIGGFVFIFVNIGGFIGMADNLPADKSTWSGGLTPVQMLGYVLPTLFLFLGDQNMYQRFAAAQTPSVAKKSALGFFVGDVLFYFVVAFLASAAAFLLPTIEADTAVLRLATDTLPLALGAILLMASTAFIITTGNSYLLSSAGNLVHDIYRSFSRRAVDTRRYLLLTRVAIVCLGIIAYMTGEFFPSVLEIQVFAYTMYGAVVTPSLLAVFLWKRATPAGSIVSILTGIVATTSWEFILDKPFGWNSILFSLPLAILALIIVSLCSTPHTTEPTEPATTQ